MDAFDADVLIYAAVRGHALGRRVAALFAEEGLQPDDPPTGLGSVLLLPELMIKPTRDHADHEIVELAGLVGQLDLRPVDAETAALAVSLGATYGLGTVDSVHLATAVAAGADRFITNNSSDFGRAIAEVAITYPIDLDDPASSLPAR